MGVLAPLYLAGLAALSLPLIFHLIRRTPRGRQVFSSLLFLMPSPPRLTRRSRLDQILLLLLRLAALALLAFAFARPFLREAATLALEDLPSRRVAILIDTSASMRRGDLWQQALRQAEKELDDLGPHDEVALYTCSDRLQTVADFSSAESSDAVTRKDIIKSRLKSLSPTWSATDLGAALSAVASELDAASDLKQLAAEPQIILISDFQKGARTEALQSFEWPKRVRVIARNLSPRSTTNAFAHLLISEEDAPEAELRVRVVNAADSAGDQFSLHWAAAKVADSLRESAETAVYVPPGQSRVVRLPRPESNLLADRIVLEGDDHDFDNTFYVVPPLKQEVKLLYIGSDAADDQRGPQYYLRLATSGDPLRQVDVQTLAGDDAAPLTTDSPPQLVVATRSISAALRTALATYVQRGGTLLVAPSDRDAAVSLVPLFDDVELRQQPSEGADYLLLGEIDFSHPLFSPFANPRYSDFTKIHFWKHRPLVVKDSAAVSVIARFDNGDPALLEKVAGTLRVPSSNGRIYLLASSWHPDDSQLALSSKFVPLIAALLDQACGTGQTLDSVVIGQSVALSAEAPAPLIVQKPNGTTTQIINDSPLITHHSPTFTQTDEPGIYRAGAGPGELRFAVNLASAESNTAPMDMSQLEQLGVPLAAGVSRAQQLDRIRQQRDTELESRQKIWRWLIVGVLGVLIVETALAGRTARQVVQTMEAAV
jgi:hypothetical protein